MLYNPKTAAVNATTVGTLTVVDAHALPHLKLSKMKRALLGADILDGITLLQNLTTTQVAAAVGVSPSYILAARRLLPLERAAVEHGQRPLVQQQRQKLQLKLLVPNCASVTDSYLETVIRAAGVDRVLDVAAVVDHG